MIIWFVFCLLFTLQVAKSLGGSEPIFDKSSFLRGETARFFFEIDNFQSVKQDCTYSINGLNPLTITFDQEKITLDSHNTGRVYGTLSIPSSAEVKIYTGTLSVSCIPQFEMKISGSSSSSIRQSFSLPFNVNVVGEITGERQVVNVELPEKPKASPIILVLIIIVLILAIIGFIFSRKKKTQ